MDTEATDTTLKYLKEMASSISQKSTLELQGMKDELDEYAKDITSKMPKQAKDVMAMEITKCRTCAREWLCVYKDSEFHPDVKDDILKEEVIEFFFSMNEKIVAVQKKFFLLEMVNDILQPGKPFSQQGRKDKIAKSRIRIQAREQGLNASYKIQPSPQEESTTALRLWFFGDETNFLQSSDEGLTDEQALDYLLN